MLQSKIAIGSMDKRIKIQSPIIGDGSANSDIITGWTDFATIWSRVSQDRASEEGKEDYYADRLTYSQSTTFTIRFRDGIKTTMRIVYKSKPYLITSITENNFSRDRYLDLVGSIVDNETV